MNDKPEFAVQGERVADALMKAADEILLDAENLKERTKILVDSIKANLDDHTIKLADVNRRVRALSESVIAAHEKFINGK
jgi:cytochrome c556